MAMSKGDFEAVAEAVRESRRVFLYNNPDATPEEREAGLSALETVARKLATACAGQYKGSAAFKRQTFVEACGFPEA